MKREMKFIFHGIAPWPIKTKQGFSLERSEGRCEYQNLDFKT